MLAVLGLTAEAAEPKVMTAMLSIGVWRIGCLLF